MKNLYLKKWLAILALLVAGAAGAQDIHFSQFGEMPLYRNPALAGIITGDIRVLAVYRNQWNSVANPYRTVALSGEYKMPVGRGDDFLTLGMLLFNDRAGTVQLSTTHILPVLNFHKSISNERNMYLSAGFMAGWVQRSIDPSKITTNNQYEGLGGSENISGAKYSYFDGSAGISFNSGIGNNPADNMVIGVAYHHFTRPQLSFFNDAGNRVNPKLVFNADVKFGVAENATLLIQADYSMQGRYTETIGGVMYGLKIGPLLDKPDCIIHGGAYLRLNDAIIPTLKLDYHGMSFGLSYDVNVSKLKTTSHGRGGFELSLAYIGFTERNNSSLNSLRCPRF